MGNPDSQKSQVLCENRDLKASYFLPVLHDPIENIHLAICLDRCFLMRTLIFS